MDREALRNVFPALGPVRSIKDIQQRIAELARGKKPGEWIVTMPIGDPPYYFDVPDILAEKRWPTRQELDAAAPNNPVYIRAIWGFWRGTFPIVSCANTEALKRAGITRDTASPSPTLAIQKDSKRRSDRRLHRAGDAADRRDDLVSRGDAVLAGRPAARAAALGARVSRASRPPACFEGHGAATELLGVYKQAYRDGTLTMRATLALSPNWTAAGDAPLGPFVEAWAGWLGEPAFGNDWLKMSGLYVAVSAAALRTTRARSAAPYTGWAGFNSNHGLPRDKVKELLLALRQERHPRLRDRRRRRARHARPVRRGRPHDPAQGPALGDQPYQRDLAARRRAHRPHGARC